MFAQCAELEKDRGDILSNLRLMKADALREREEVLEQIPFSLNTFTAARVASSLTLLGKLMMKLKSYSKEIEYWENLNNVSE
jgi:hypothetical protein